MNPSLEELQPFFLVDIAIMKSTYNYIEGHFFTFLRNGLNFLYKRFEIPGLKSLSNRRMWGKHFLKGSESLEICTLRGHANSMYTCKGKLTFKCFSMFSSFIYKTSFTNKVLHRCRL